MQTTGDTRMNTSSEIYDAINAKSNGILADLGLKPCNYYIGSMYLSTDHKTVEIHVYNTGGRFITDDVINVKDWA